MALLMMPSLCYALPPGSKVEPIGVPSGGLDTNNPSFKLSSKFSPYMRNVYIDNGKIEGIKGFTVLGSTFSLQKVTGIFPFYRESGLTTFLVTDSSVTMETTDFNTWVMISSRSNTGSNMNWMQVRNKMWGFNGVDFVLTWDGSVLQKLNGALGMPNVPKFKYGAYWQERVWGFNNPSGASDLDFSAVVTTDAVIINPDDYRAWPVTNNLKIGQGDGEIGTALYVRDGQLRCGKERSQYTIYGTNVSNYFPRKNSSNSIGIVSNDSVVNMDDHTYYLSQNGIYQDEQRISDLIQDDVEQIYKGKVQVIGNVWESAGDFIAKGMQFGTTVTPTGLLSMTTVQISTTAYGGGNTFGYFDDSVDNLSNGAMNASTTFYGPLYVNFNTRVSSEALVYLSSITVWINGSGGLRTTILNRYTGQYYVNDLPRNDGNVPSYGNPPEGQFYTILLSSQAPIFEGWQIHGGSFAVKWELRDIGSFPTDAITIACCANTPSISVDPSGRTTRDPIWGLAPATTVQYVSEVTTANSVTAWGNFDSLNFPNQGQIDFFIKTGTGVQVVSQSTNAWQPITPGTIINAVTANRFFQWATTMSVVQFSSGVAAIDNVEIDHIEGAGSLNRAFATSWKNRYWLATSTDGGDVFSLIYVKSIITNDNPHAWMPLEGMNVRCFAKDGNILYAGSSSSGSVLRLDYGTNYDGTAIPYVYDTPDMTLGANYTSKSILNYFLDADKDTALTMNVGTSIDQGSFNTRTISLSGSGRSLTTIKGVTNPCKTLRVKLSHNQLDKKFNIYDFSVLYQPSEVWE